MLTNSITLKDDFTFLVSDTSGDVEPGAEGHGMYLNDTRYLSRLQTLVNGLEPQLLSYTLDYIMGATFRLSVPYQAQIQGTGTEPVPGADPAEPVWTLVSHAVGMTRRRYIKRGLIESLEITNYHIEPVKLSLAFRLSADFADMFEVRGVLRSTHGYATRLEVQDGGERLVFFTEPTSTPGVPPDAPRTVLLEVDRRPDRVEHLTAPSPLNNEIVPEALLHYDLELPPHSPLTLRVRVFPEPTRAIGGLLPSDLEPAAPFDMAVAGAQGSFNEWQQSCTGIESNSYVLDRIIESGTLDLRSLMQQQAQSSLMVVTAGLPWYFTLFGRDSIITSLETLCLNPQIAIDTLRALASYQATGFDDWRDSEPGKILHELRRGDMTISGEMPHSPYYGSVDSTPLFVLLYAEVFKWVEDLQLFTELWPNVEHALTWAERYGDMDGDGYIEFSRRSRRGILHQGWKDSDESMGGYVGPHPEPPVALVEVQGYYYAALMALAEVLRRYGNKQQRTLAAGLQDRAARLKEQFNRDFWWSDEGYFAQALDGKKAQVRNITSNVGHCLWSGIIDEDKAAPVAARLVQPDMLSGWGIRTMSTRDRHYNPMSYHNGSVWPHDNALIVAGLRRYGYETEAHKVASEVLDAAATFSGYRLPELYCGFDRGEGEARESAPAEYPVSCSPQAWAAGTPIFLLQSLLDLQANAAEGRITTAAPCLPEGVDRLVLRGLRLGGERLELSFVRDKLSGQVRVLPVQGVEPAAAGSTQSPPTS